MSKTKSKCTEYGKLLRHIRIDNDETALEMCEKVGLSHVYLTFIENGKRDIPDDLTAKLFYAYELDNDMKVKLIKAEALARGYLHIDLSLIPDNALDDIVSNIFRKEE